MADEFLGELRIWIDGKLRASTVFDPERDTSQSIAARIDAELNAPEPEKFPLAPPAPRSDRDWKRGPTMREWWIDPNWTTARQRPHDGEYVKPCGCLSCTREWCYVEDVTRDDGGDASLSTCAECGAVWQSDEGHEWENFGEDL